MTDSDLILLKIYKKFFNLSLNSLIEEMNGFTFDNSPKNDHLLEKKRMN